jgi:tetratricopeptide (TPR) repeat protein
MNRVQNAGLAVLLLLPFAACAPAEEGQQVEMAAASANVVMVMPVTTASTEALDHFMQGQRASDMGRGVEAREHFEQATGADPYFALAHLNLAWSANSLESFQKNLKAAADNAEGASEAEQLLIKYTQYGFENDNEGQMKTAQALVELLPESPRAWMILAGEQSSMDDEEAARTTYLKVVAMSPDFAPAHMALGNSFMFIEPRDLAKAQQHMQHAVDLEPDEATTHDLLGDAYRARGELEMAAEEYTRTAELNPKSGNGFQQRAHVNSFLGNFDQARDDYSASIALEQGNGKASFAVYRALVSVHEGNPEAAIEELNELVGNIDALGIPNPRGQKIFALNTLITIAQHNEMVDVAKAAIEQRDALVKEQAMQAGTPAAERNAKGTVVLGEGYLALRSGDFETAKAKGKEYMSIQESNTSPFRDRAAHALLGLTSLLEGNFDEAIAHYEQANPNNMYVAYHHALALEGAGRTDEAAVLFDKVANYNFNSVSLALVRKDAMAKVM